MKHLILAIALAHAPFAKTVSVGPGDDRLVITEQGFILIVNGERMYDSDTYEGCEP